MAPPAGGSNATTEVSENLLSIFARFPGRGPPSTGVSLFPNVPGARRVANDKARELGWIV